MAFNLYSGIIKKEFEIDYPIVINKNDDMIKQEFEIKNIFSTDSILHNNVNVGAYKLNRISKLKMNFNFISEHDADKFAPVEEVIKNLLIKYSHISNRARHGISKLKECDIVDETTNKQIEVITEFKNRLKKDKTPQKKQGNIFSNFEFEGGIFRKCKFHVINIKSLNAKNDNILVKIEGIIFEENINKIVNFIKNELSIDVFSVRLNKIKATSSFYLENKEIVSNFNKFDFKKDNFYFYKQ